MSKLLVVDDDPGVRRAHERVLRPLGHTVILAESTAEALDALAQGGVRVVITDHNMPVMRAGTPPDGLELLRVVKAQYPGVGRVFVTSEENLGSQAVAEGAADAFFRKPFAPADVRECVTRLTGAYPIVS